MPAELRRQPLLPEPLVEAAPVASPRDVLLRSWPGRIFLVSAAVKLLLAVIGRLTPLPLVLDIVGIAATLGLAISLGYFLWRLVILSKRRLLWRVRRRLIIS